MGRIDTSSPALYDEMVDCGCVGMRFGVESFSQQLLDNTKKRLDARVSYDNIRYLLTHFSNMEFHFTTMKNLPGEVAADWEADLAILNDLQELGRRSGNIVHWQNSDCGIDSGHRALGRRWSLAAMVRPCRTSTSTTATRTAR